MSPAMQNAAFEALGLDIAYVPFRVRPADLPPAVNGLRALAMVGANITVPHKEAIVPLLDGISAEARALGAVNTVVRRGRRLLGHNTDSGGFSAALGASGVQLAGRSAVLIGAGGAARAVVAALQRGRCRDITLINRTPERARRLVRQMQRPRRRLVTAPWSALADDTLIGRADLIVNCTPLGLAGEHVDTLAYDAARPGCVFVDLVYGSAPTPFLRRAQRLGRPTVDGTGMLLHQGALAFSLWTGRRAPLAVMARALRRARGARGHR
jgi:shikimate dehydrogenase